MARLYVRMAQIIRTAGRILKTDIVVDYWLQPENVSFRSNVRVSRFKYFRKIIVMSDLLLQCKLKRFLTSVGAQNADFIEKLRTSSYSFHTSNYNKKLLVQSYQVRLRKHFSMLRMIFYYLLVFVFITDRA